MANNSCAAFENLSMIEVRTLRRRLYLVKMKRGGDKAHVKAVWAFADKLKPTT
jgi:hypothetical protein